MIASQKCKPVLQRLEKIAKLNRKIGRALIQLEAASRKAFEVDKKVTEYGYSKIVKFLDHTRYV